MRVQRWGDCSLPHIIHETKILDFQLVFWSSSNHTSQSLFSLHLTEELSSPTDYLSEPTPDIHRTVVEGNIPLIACYFGDFLVKICIWFERKPETLLLKTIRKYIHCTQNDAALLQALMHSEVNSASWEYGDTHTHTHTHTHCTQMDHLL